MEQNALANDSQVQYVKRFPSSTDGVEVQSQRGKASTSIEKQRLREEREEDRREGAKYAEEAGK